MARKTSAKVILNRGAVDKVMLAMADGLFAVGREIIESADVPDATPFGEGLVTQGGVLAYVNGQKVAGWGQDGKQPRAPRAAKVSKAQGATVIVGWGFPARFLEFGTVKMAAQPFVTPARDATLPNATAIMAPAVQAKLP